MGRLDGFTGRDAGSLEAQRIGYQRDIRAKIAEADEAELRELAEEYAEVAKLRHASTAGARFLDSVFGRFVLERAIKSGEAAKDDMMNLHRADFDNQFGFDAVFTQLQNDANIPNMIFAWINEAIQAARDAGILTEEDEENA